MTKEISTKKRSITFTFTRISKPRPSLPSISDTRRRPLWAELGLEMIKYRIATVALYRHYVWASIFIHLPQSRTTPGSPHGIFGPYSIDSHSIPTYSLPGSNDRRNFTKSLNEVSYWNLTETLSHTFLRSSYRWTFKYSLFLPLVPCRTNRSFVRNMPSRPSFLPLLFLLFIASVVLTSSSLQARDTIGINPPLSLITGHSAVAHDVPVAPRLLTNAQRLARGLPLNKPYRRPTGTITFSQSLLVV